MTRARAAVVWLLPSCAVLAAGAPPAHADPATPDRLDAFVTKQMHRADVPGVAYSVVGAHGTEHQATFGMDGNDEPITPTTSFLWGSVAKPVTASLVVKLAEAKVLDLDAPVSEYLPGFTMDDSTARTITVRHLLSHTGGIPERLDLTDRYKPPDRRPGDIVAELEDTHLAAPVGHEHLYSSVNYILLAAIVEKVTGQDFTDALRQRLLEPAGMGTAITTPEQAAEQLPPGHRYVFGGTLPFRTGFAPAEIGSGYLAGTLEDLAAFARANLPGSRVLTANQRAMLHAPEASTGEHRSYGLGWRTWRVFGSREPIVWHAGAAPGFQSAIVLLPDQDRAVVVLQNAYGTFQESQLLDTAWGLASLLAGVQPERHGVEPSYTVFLAALSLTCLGLVASLFGSLRRLRQHRKQWTSRRALADLAGWWGVLLLLGSGLLSLPRMFGVTTGQVWQWAPDTSGLLWLALGVVVLLAASRAAVTLRTLQRTTKR